MKKPGINVLSAFNGMGCIWIALENIGIKVNKRYSSEIDKHANKVNDAMYPDTIQLGSIVDVKAKDLESIDLFTFGSPCQGFSTMGKGLNFKDPRSALFFEAVRLLKEIRKINPDVLFLMENVPMKHEYETIISQYLNISPIAIDSALVSGQHRIRLYWTNIFNKPFGLFGHLECKIPQPKDRGVLLKDILEKDVDEKYFLKKHQLKWWKGGHDIQIDNSIEADACIKFGRTEEAKKIRRESKKTHGKDYSPFQEKKIVGLDYEKMNTIVTSVNKDNLIMEIRLGRKPRIRRLTPRECGRLQTIPNDKLDIMLNCGVSENQLYKMFGNGWNCNTISHILSYIDKK